MAKYILDRILCWFQRVWLASGCNHDLLGRISKNGWHLIENIKTSSWSNISLMPHEIHITLKAENIGMITLISAVPEIKLFFSNCKYTLNMRWCPCISVQKSIRDWSRWFSFPQLREAGKVFDAAILIGRRNKREAEIWSFEWHENQSALGAVLWGIASFVSTYGLRMTWQRLNKHYGMWKKGTRVTVLSYSVFRIWIVQWIWWADDSRQTEESISSKLN